MAKFKVTFELDAASRDEILNKWPYASDAWGPSVNLLKVSKENHKSRQRYKVWYESCGRKYLVYSDVSARRANSFRKATTIGHVTIEPI